MIYFKLLDIFISRESCYVEFIFIVGVLRFVLGSYWIRVKILSFSVNGGDRMFIGEVFDRFLIYFGGFFIGVFVWFSVKF